MYTHRDRERERKRKIRRTPHSLLFHLPLAEGEFWETFLFLCWCTEILCNESFTQGSGELGALA